MGRTLIASAGSTVRVKRLDLELDLSRTIGRKPAKLGGEVVRELTRSDLELLATERAIKPTSIKRISERHHALARVLATGASDGIAALTCGYTPSRISILKSDPAFEELVAFYREDRGAEVQDLAQKLTTIAKDAADEIASRLEESPETLGPDFLLDVVKVGADRTGHGPKSTNVNVNVNLGDRMKAARERAGQRLLPSAPGGPQSSDSAHPTGGQVIEGQFTEVPQAEGLRRYTDGESK
jgi:hypothetical protein